MIGASFQPGIDDKTLQGRPRSNGSSDGVQEAIKVLSLRLPKVVGAQAVAPSALLQSGGSGGNPHVDSIVQKVLSQMFPTQASMPQDDVPVASPMMQEPTSTFTPAATQTQQQQPKKVEETFWEKPRLPQVIVGPPQEGPMTGGPPRYPGSAQIDGGWGNFGMVGQLPDLRQLLNWLPGSAPAGGDDNPLI